ncbi:MAG: helix-hairpin-helix domain-containing protein [Actinomycetes bacterium]
MASKILDRLAAVIPDLDPVRAQPPPPRPPDPEDGSGMAERRRLRTVPVAPAEEELADDLANGVSRLGSTGGFGRFQVGVVAALVLVGLVCAGWAVLRARPVALAAPVPVPSVAGTSNPPRPTPARSGPTVPPTTIMVHVLGAVRRPGVVTLPERGRVRDAIAEAGGLRGNADLAELNLAQVLADGQQLLIGTERHPAGAVRDGSGPSTGGGRPSGGSPSSASAGTPVDLNQATEAQLDQLPGVGPVTAGRILGWRTEHGRFTRVEELQEVDGIGPKTYAQILPHVRV